MSILHEWAAAWGIPAAAVADLQMRIVSPQVSAPSKGVSEAAVQAAVRLEAGQKRVLLWRNNVGALLDKRGIPVRYGLANDSAQMNAHIKSADLIGIRPVLITQAHVGTTIGQFVSREVKEVGWRFNPGDQHERAQLTWAELVTAAGGDACFAAGTGTL